MRKLLIGLIFLAAVLLSGCFETINQGYVYDKQYIPASYDSYPGYYTSSCDSDGYCTERYHGGYTSYSAAEYLIYIDSCKHNQGNSECKTGVIEVDQPTYDKYTFGEYYNG